MSDLFNIYEDNLNILINRIQTTIDTMSNLSKGIALVISDKTEYAITDTHNCFKEADKLVLINKLVKTNGY
jgi:hypothetical protein